MNERSISLISKWSLTYQLKGDGQRLLNPRRDTHKNRTQPTIFADGIAENIGVQLHRMPTNWNLSFQLLHPE